MKEGDRQRLQAFEGVVIGKRNRGLNSAFTVRKISNGVGVERTFQSYSPMVDSISVKRRGDAQGQAVLPPRAVRQGRPHQGKAGLRPPFANRKAALGLLFVSAASKHRAAVTTGGRRRPGCACRDPGPPRPAVEHCRGRSDSYRHAHARPRNRPLPRCPLAGKGLADNSREAYRNDLASFNGWLQERGVRRRRAREVILDHLAWRLNNGYKARSTARFPAARLLPLPAA